MSEHPYEWYSEKPGWKNATAISEDAQIRKTEKREFRELVKQRDKLRKQADEIWVELKKICDQIRKQCPHKVKYHKAKVSGREDDYGSYRSGKDYYIYCDRCEETIAKWGESGNFFGIDKNGKHCYGTKLEYYQKKIDGLWLDSTFKDKE